MASSKTEPSQTLVHARVWDGVTRFVHWALVALLGFSWWSATTSHMNWHQWSGCGVLGLIAFRLMWGVVGSQSAQFRRFIRGPRATLAYLRALPQRSDSSVAGHNPLGIWSALTILAALLFQVSTGLYAVDIDGIESGPLANLVDFETGRLLAQAHALSFKTLQILVAVHVTAVLFYLIYKRTNLITPMLTGKRWLSQDPQFAFASGRRAAAVALIAFALAWGALKGFQL
jgi:cytochrome b